MSGLINKIKEVINKMLDKNKIAQKFNFDIAISAKMMSSISRWSNIYHNRAKWLLEDKDLVSLGLGQTIASEFAKKTTIELKTKVEGNDQLGKIYKKALRRIRINLGIGLAKGGFIMKPFFDGNKIVTEYVMQDTFIVTECDSEGNITGAIFPSYKVVGKKFYTKLEKVRYENQIYYIENYLFESNSSDVLGKEVPLTTIKEWKKIESRIEIQNVERPLFVYFGVPVENEVDPISPLSPSIYAKAVGLLEQADRQFTRSLWEYEGSELAIDIDETAFKIDGKTQQRILPKGKERYFRKFSAEDGDKTFYNVFSPAIRDTSLFNGLNEILIQIENKCGMSRGTLSKLVDIAKTATEIESSKQTMYTTITDIQNELTQVFEDLAYCIDILMQLYDFGGGTDYLVSTSWGDSILVDQEASRRQALLDKNVGIIDEVEYIMETKKMPEREAEKFYIKMRKREAKYKKMFLETEEEPEGDFDE